MELQMIRSHWLGCIERKKWMHEHAHIRALDNHDQNHLDMWFTVLEIEE
jgi:hypothetical protein